MSEQEIGRGTTAGSGGMLGREAAEPRGRSVPSGRLERLARLGGTASGIAARMAAHGAREFASGRRPSLRDLALTPANLGQLADELARMRGAAMKLGQLLSMDAGDMLPPELAEILARLRAEAEPMPPKQLKRVLAAEWGDGWLSRFARFDARPMAAASIGQVHYARTRDGRTLAVKVQYPGVRRSIDSDVTNLGAIIRLAGLAPQGVDLAPFLEEARRQLHEEADYAREAEQTGAYAAALGPTPGFVLPEPQEDLTTENVLAMTYLPGRPIEEAATLPQAVRDSIAERLLDLMLREVFTFGLMQTDPNFANYSYDAETDRIALLDFGAARPFAPQRIAAYRHLMLAAADGGEAALEAAAEAVGYLDDTVPDTVRKEILALMTEASAPLRVEGPFDFTDDATARLLRDRSLDLAAERDYAVVPPMDTLYLQRKAAGMYLLCRRLRARVDLRALVARYR